MSEPKWEMIKAGSAVGVFHMPMSFDKDSKIMQEVTPDTQLSRRPYSKLVDTSLGYLHRGITEFLNVTEANQ